VQLAEAWPSVYHPLINQILIAVLRHINETVECAKRGITTVIFKNVLHLYRGSKAFIVSKLFILFVGVVLSVRVDAVPHDLLKVVDWGRHASRKVVEDFFPERVREKYRIPHRNIEGKIEFRSLERVISGHHSRDAFWERLWSYADRLSTVAGRFRLEYDYWYWSGADPFFVKVYGDVKEWGREARDSLAKAMRAVLEEYCDREGEQHRAFEEINDLLKDYPSDSRFPYTSLKTHHWLTDALRRNETLWRRCFSRDPVFDSLYIIRVSISETQFHRLKEVRGFIELRERILEIARSKLFDFFPLRIGGDLYLACLEESEKDKVVSMLAELGFGFDVTVFKWRIAREKRLVGPEEEPEEHIYVIKEAQELPQVSVGAYEVHGEYAPESSAEYSRILEGEYEYVAWVSVEPKGDMMELAQSFLEWGERELKARYGSRRRELKEPVREPTALLSPEIALSIAEGYSDFLEDCAKAINPSKPEESVVVKSFDRTIFIRGLNDLSEGLNVYNGIAEAKAKLHIPSVFSVVVTKPKYPFWRILELFKTDVDCIVFVVGEKMVKLTDDVVKLLRETASTLRDTSRSQFSDIIRASRRAGLEELKFIIEGKAADSKIPPQASKKLCWLIDELSKRYKGDELKSVLWRCFKSLEPYTRREVRRWRE
jgi:hypothetical protein